MRAYSESELDQFARELAFGLSLGDVLLLEGGLGAGKTTLARKIIKVLRPDHAIDTGSPTFPIAFELPLTSRTRLLHIDLYRIQSFAELEQTGVLDSIGSENCVTLIEWGSLFKEIVRGVKAESIVRIEIENDPNDHSLRKYRVVRAP